jgi:hypothetical protein
MIWEACNNPLRVENDVRLLKEYTNIISCCINIPVVLIGSAV